MSTRAAVEIFSASGTSVGSVDFPTIFNTAIRPDLVRYVHTNMRKNSRQAYAISPESGYQTSAQSWGTGRAMARIPRVAGSGTARAGQGAFGNMCRDGGMYAPTKTYRRWHRKINKTEKRHAVASALAATSVAGIVMARGHKIEGVPSIPLVVSDEFQNMAKTKDAVKGLKALGLGEELERVEKTKTIRAGKGKLRGRKYKQRKGLLFIFDGERETMNAFRNIPGVELANVESLSLLKLAPGGVCGRLVAFSKAAFEKINSVYAEKTGYNMFHGVALSSDISRIINSDEIQSVIRPKKVATAPRAPKLNPLKSDVAVKKLCIKKL